MRILGFQPALIPTLFTVPAVILMIGLGTWQVDRLMWKRDLIRTVEARVHAEAVPLPAQIDNPKDWDYRRVSVTGVLLHDKEMHLVAPAAMGTSGYHVLTPMRRADGGYIIINRGWIPTDRTNPATRREGQMDGNVTITGIARSAWSRGRFAPDNNPEKNVWFHADLAAMASHAAIGPAPALMVEADATPNPGGWPRGGQTRLDFPNNHLAYVVTWYSGAVVLLAIYVVWHRRREQGN